MAEEKKELERGKHEMDLTTGAILPKMLLFTVPIVLSSLLQLLFNAADVIVVGRFAGDNSLAAVGSTGALVNLLTNLFLGVGVGVNVMAARFYGARNRKDLSDTIHTSMLFSIVGGFVLTGIGLTLAEPMLVLMQTPEKVLSLAALYLRIYFLGMPALMIYNFGSAVLRAKGDTRRPLIYLSIAGVLNVVLNLFFVIVLKMDVAGVGAATAISQCLSALLIWICLTREEEMFRLDWRKLKLHTQRLLEVLRIGVPAGFEGIVFAISNVMIQAAINGFGEVVVAGSSAASNIEGFVFMGMYAFSQSILSFMGQNMGAGRFDRIRRITRVNLACTTVMGLALGGLASLFAKPLMGIYSSSPAVIDAGAYRLIIMCLPYFLCGAMDSLLCAVRGLGHSFAPMLTSVLSICAFRIAWLYTIFRIPRFHTPGVVYWSYPVSWIVALISIYVIYLLVVRREVTPHLTAKQTAC